MANDHGFCVIKQLKFDQVITAPNAIGRVLVAQHQAFRALLAELAQLLHQCGVVRHLPLRRSLHPGLRDALYQLLQRLVALGEASAVLRQVKHHVAQLLPTCFIFAALCHRGLHFGKLPAPGPQLTVQGVGRPACREPGRGFNRQALAAEELLAVPVGANAIVFFADPVVRQVQVGVVGGGEGNGGVLCV